MATKRKDGLRQTYVTVGYKPDGKPIRRYVYGRTKKEADDKAAELRTQLQSGVQVAAKKGTVGEYLDRWLARVKAQVGTSSTQPRTYMGYEQHVRLHLKPALGHLSFAPQCKLTPFHLEELYYAKLQAGKSPQTVKHIHRVIHTALQAAFVGRLISYNPAAGLKPPKVPRKRQPALGLDDVLRYFDALGNHRLRALYIMAALTALRQSELFGLRWQDLDLESRVATVEQKVQHIDGKLLDADAEEPGYEAWFGPLKTEDSRRRVPLIHQLADELRQHRDRQGFERRAAKGAWQEHDLVFCQPDGSPLRPFHVHNPHFAALEQGKCRRIPFKNLRHTTAVLLIALGVPLKIVAEILGHTSIKLAGDVYGSDVSVEVQRQAMDRLGKALFGEGSQ